MNMTLTPVLDSASRRFKRRPSGHAAEITVHILRELAVGKSVCDQPHLVAEYWRGHIASHPTFDPMKEHLVVLALNTRRKIMAHNLVALGTLDTVLAHPREVFRPLVAVAAAAFILCHNHPSGDPTPSEGDIKVTRDLIRAGQMMKIELLDHVILGDATPDRPKDFSSLRELGYL